MRAAHTRNPSLTPKLVAQIEASEILLEVCRLQLRSKNAARTFAFAELAMEFEEKIAALKPQAETLTLADHEDASAAVGNGGSK